MRFKLTLFLVPLLMTPVSGQTPIAAIQDAHGGAAFLKDLSAYKVSGTLYRPGGSETLFSLVVDGDKSRFETNENVSVYNGDVQQWWKKGGQRSQASYSFHGAQEIYLSPLYTVGLLGKFQFDGGDQVDRFSHKPKNRRFVNYQPETQVIDADFDKETHRLTEIFFYTEERASAGLTLSFEDYRQYGRVWFPSKVTQQAGGRLLATLKITAVDFSPVLSSDTFTITR